ncbi:MAG: RnfABCDGE type electron transport complex subunit G [Thermotogota bacterium]|nr:RnfABCDGE type electron transport complex subunit G [Thermotogota bacterium]
MLEYLKTGFVLMLITLIAGLGLSFVYNLVKEPIANAELGAKLQAIRKVLTDPGSGKLLVDKNTIPETTAELKNFEWEVKNFEAKDGIIYASEDGKGKVQDPVYKFSTDDNREIYVLTGQAVGYGGDVITVAGFISSDGGISLNSIKVIEYSQETPGLGANISQENIQERFYPVSNQGLSENLKVNKDANVVVSENEIKEYRNERGIIQVSDVMTGATITPRAVTTSLNAMYEFLKKAGAE